MRYPRWFVTLFCTDMWERFSFYGMQALLVLFATAPVSAGGLGLGGSSAGALFGLYIAAAFVLPLAGGWLGDRLLGSRRATLYGAIVIAAGHYWMMAPLRAYSLVGLVFIAAGTGLMKPNLAATLSRFYGPGDAPKREAAFSIFYMSIQVSALLAPLVTGILGERVQWHAGFGAAAIGMTIGVIYYAATSGRFGDVGREPVDPIAPAALRRVLRRTALVAAPVVALLGLDIASGHFAIEHALGIVGLSVLIVPVLYFRAARRRAGTAPAARRRLRAVRWLFLSSALFWLCFAQAGSVLSLFARDDVARRIGGFTVPASWFQSTTPLFILLGAPVVAWLWVRLGHRVGVAQKYAIGLALMGASFAVLALATASVSAGGRVGAGWLVAAFALQAFGEVALAPVGLAASADAGPAGATGQLMGLFFVSAALGAGLGSQVSRLWTVAPHPAFFGGLAVAGLLAAGILVLANERLNRALYAEVPDTAEAPAQPVPALALAGGEA
ncbi:MAG: hypothetical protein AUG44_05050 [Actinobacteria bacterium 13_1_20CM_3_71_11]|nr:MAG: hypothetical protein AUG44_05050 [Actinobacteria bacterium 13_1_20CM_3_71_11]